MRKGKKLAALICVFLLSLLAAMPIQASAATPKLNKTKLSLSAGKSYTLKVSNASGKTVNDAFYIRVRSYHIQTIFTSVSFMDDDRK